MRVSKSPSPEREDILRLILFRLIIITSLIVSAVIIQYSTSTFLPLNPFYYLILLSYILSFLYFIIYLLGKGFTIQVYIQIFFDLLLITALVYISGGIKGSFYFLYIFEIIAASIVLSNRAAYVTAALSAIFFGSLVEGMYFGVLPYFSTEQTMEISLGAVTNNIFISWSVFFLMAFLMNSLTGRLREAREELRLAQKELEIKNRLAAAGEISAQLAHEIRNPLAAISGSVQLLKDELGLNEKQGVLMDIVIKESQRVSTSIEQFLNLASPGKQTFSSIDLPAVLSETLALLQRGGELDGNCRIEGNYKSAKVRYFGNPNQFKQIFWNLIRNALKAMPQGGTLTIDFNRIKGREIQVRFADTGKGMSEEEREKVFEPFYSGFKDGSGIGMVVVRRIIEDYNGKIEVASKLNKGTEIVITLPRMKLRKRAEV